MKLGLDQHGWSYINIDDAWQGKRKSPGGPLQSNDINDNWNWVKEIGFSQGKGAAFTGPGHWNDPDMLVLGNVGWGKPHPTKLSPDEQYTHISLWCLLSSPLLLGCDLEKMDDFTLSLLTNDEVIEVDQDPLGAQAIEVSRQGDLHAFAKPMEDGSLAVGLFNLSLDETPVKVTWDDLHLKGKQKVRDLWRQKDLGTFSDVFSTPVPSHGVVLLRLAAAK